MDCSNWTALAYYKSRWSTSYPAVFDSLESVHGATYFSLCSSGVISNICFAMVLARPALRRNIFNQFLFVISLCDITVMTMYMLYQHFTPCYPMYHTHMFAAFTQYYAIISMFAHAFSLWLTVAMAILRYGVLIRGLHPRLNIPNCNSQTSACVAMTIAFFIAAAGSLPNAFFYEVHILPNVPVVEVAHTCFADARKKQPEHLNYWKARLHLNMTAYGVAHPEWYTCTFVSVNYWTVSIVLKLLPCVILSIFMALLIRILYKQRRQRAKCMPGASSAQPERTTLMLTAIVAVFLCTEMPQGLLALAAGFSPDMQALVKLLGKTFDLMSLVNSSVNFIMYALMSHSFRREGINMCLACMPNSTSHDSGVVLSDEKRCNEKRWLLGHLRRKSNRSLRSDARNGFTLVPTATVYCQETTNCPEPDVETACDSSPPGEELGLEESSAAWKQETEN